MKTGARIYTVSLFCVSWVLSSCNSLGGSDETTFGGTSSPGSSSTTNTGGTTSTSGTAPPAPSPSSSTTSSTVGLNVLPIQVGGSGVCGETVNEPCASVTICVPGTSSCQTISNILIDTGSYGLRIFSSALSLALQPVTNSANQQVAECAQFGTGNDWGPVMMASVQLASEPFVQVPIQVINSSYASGPPAAAVSAGCTVASLDTSPSEAGFNGILGVGLFTQDCGEECQTNSANGVYFSCSGSSCAGTTLSTQSQVQNPVALLPFDNNGVIVNLPAISTSGDGSVSGTVTLGIGTQANNMPSGVTAYGADTYGNFTTNFNGGSYSESFIDSGSNGLFFPAPSSLVTCSNSSSAPGWFCPTSTTGYSATNVSTAGGPSRVTSFEIANASDLVESNNVAFNDIGASSSASGFTSSFDWGLPFFFGTKVYVGIVGMSSSLGTGPYWAY